MFSCKEAQSIADKIIRLAKGKQTDVLLSNRTLSLTRYADSIITQNVSENNIWNATVKIIKGDKIAKVSINQTDDSSLKKAIDNCNYFVPAVGTKLRLVTKQKYSEVNSYNEKTASVSPDHRANLINNAVETAKNNGLNISGVFSNESSAMALANSRGLFAYYPSSSAAFSCTALTEDSSGKASQVSKDINQIDSAQLSKTAVNKALKSKNPIDLKAGQYTVILEPAAVVEFLFFMAYRGFGALAFQEGRSFMSGQMGKRIMGENISIQENTFHPDIQGMPFDFEGIPRQKVNLIDKGIALNVVYDRLTAKKATCQSTGHALPQPNPYGPLPSSLIIAPGDSSIEEMIKTTKYGILISEFHYTNLIDPMKMTITGMTRNGTFLIENGVVTNGIRNMRFTDSILRILSNVELITKETKLHQGFFGGSGFVVPSLKVNNFNFSSETKF